MLVSERIQQPYWAFLYSQFLKQTEPAKMKACLTQLEFAICERLQELTGTPESYSHKERLAIEAARQKLLEIRTNKLGFSTRWPGKVRPCSYSKDRVNTRQRGPALPPWRNSTALLIL
jgi:hypothetical protein